MNFKTFDKKKGQTYFYVFMCNKVLGTDLNIKKITKSGDNIDFICQRNCDDLMKTWI